MLGRMEHTNKFNESIDKLLQTLPSYVAEWAGNLEASGKTGSTRLAFVRIINRFLKSIRKDPKSVELDDLTFLRAQKYYISIKESNGNSTSDSYQQQVWCCLNNFFTFMKKRKYVLENPMESIEKPKNHDLDRINEERILLNEDDFNEILWAIKSSGTKIDAKFINRDLAMILLFMSTGMRKTALSEINIDDIDFDEGTLKVVDKGNKFQLYPLNRTIRKVLFDWINDRSEMELDKTDALFVSYLGTRISGTAIDKIVAKYSKKALGKKISPHKLRAGYVSIYYNKTKDIEATRRAVGHSNISTTQRYIVTDNKERREASDYILNSLNIT